MANFLANWLLTASRFGFNSSHLFNMPIVCCFIFSCFGAKLHILYTTYKFIYHLLQWYINLNSSHHKHRGKHFTVLGTLTIVIVPLYHLYTCSCCIGDVRYWKSVVDGNRDCCVSEYLGIQIKVCSKLFPNLF